VIEPIEEYSIDRITCYFDLGCGDGAITAAIGQYIGRQKQSIIGSDVFDGGNPAMTFVPMCEKKSKLVINLRKTITHR
jgi:hypothetical protein